MKVTAGIGAAAIYFAAAGCLKYSYVPLPDPPNNRIWLSGPFIRFGPSVAYIAVAPFDELADSDSHATQSPVTLYENEHPLGPTHSRHSDIATIGQGRFSHWKGVGIVFSASDNSDPNQNWKRYSILRL
jgi:hypothetical protein